jgi:hypothetical protein
MGTSTGYSLPTTGNWPSVKGNVTALGQSGIASPPHISRVMSGYVQAQGGATAAAQQTSTASRVGAKLGGLFAGIGANGFTQALQDIGLRDFVGKSASEVMRGLTDYLIESGSLLDEALVREAFQDYRDEVIGHCDTYEELDAILSRLVEMNSIGENIKRFFGYFIFRKFRRDFKERLMQVVSSVRASKQLLRDIKAYIFDRLSASTHKRDYREVNWRGPEGMQLAEDILASAWRVFGEV